MIWSGCINMAIHRIVQRTCSWSWERRVNDSKVQLCSELFERMMVLQHNDWLLQWRATLSYSQSISLCRQVMQYGHLRVRKRGMHDAHIASLWGQKNNFSRLRLLQHIKHSSIMTLSHAHCASSLIYLYTSLQARLKSKQLWGLGPLSIPSELGHLAMPINFLA